MDVTAESMGMAVLMAFVAVTGVVWSMPVVVMMR